MSQYKLQLVQLGDLLRKIEGEGGGSCFVVLVGKETEFGGNIYRCMFILTVIWTLEDDVVLQEPSGVGGGTASSM